MQVATGLERMASAWCFLMGLDISGAELSLEGVTHLTTPSPLCSFHLPKRLISLTFAKEFNQSLEGVILPNSLENLTLGFGFNQSLEDLAKQSAELDVW